MSNSRSSILATISDAEISQILAARKINEQRQREAEEQRQREAGHYRRALERQVEDERRALIHARVAAGAEGLKHLERTWKGIISLGLSHEECLRLCTMTEREMEAVGLDRLSRLWKEVENLGLSQEQFEAYAQMATEVDQRNLDSIKSLNAKYTNMIKS
jgi:hypothetical protein